jgi:hypothetical protein
MAHNNGTVCINYKQELSWNEMSSVRVNLITDFAMKMKESQIRGVKIVPNYIITSRNYCASRRITEYKIAPMQEPNGMV